MIWFTKDILGQAICLHSCARAYLKVLEEVPDNSFKDDIKSLCDKLEEMGIGVAALPITYSTEIKFLLDEIRNTLTTLRSNCVQFATDSTQEKLKVKALLEVINCISDDFYAQNLPSPVSSEPSPPPSSPSSGLGQSSHDL